jgi:hypothetical protein
VYDPGMQRAREPNINPPNSTVQALLLDVDIVEFHLHLASIVSPPDPIRQRQYWARPKPPPPPSLK